MMEAIRNIEEFMAGTDTCEAFVSNKLLCHAIVYDLQCIGECSYKLSRNYVEEHSEIDWNAICWNKVFLDSIFCRFCVGRQEMIRIFVDWKIAIEIYAQDWRQNAVV